MGSKSHHPSTRVVFMSVAVYDRGQGMKKDEYERAPFTKHFEHRVVYNRVLYSGFELISIQRCKSDHSKTK